MSAAGKRWRWPHARAGAGGALSVVLGAWLLGWPGAGSGQAPQLPPQANPRAQAQVAAHTAPAVQWLAPAAGAVVQAGTRVTLQAQASASNPARRISQIRFYASGALLGAVNDPPAGQAVALAWNATVPGRYEMSAVAEDDRGTQASTAPVSVRVNAPPSVQVTAPAAGQVLQAGASLTLSASAQDSDGAIQSVSFYQGSTLIGSGSAGPNGTYSLAWADIPAGSYQISARAVDNDAAVADSASVRLRVNAPPSIQLSAPTDGARVIAGAAGATITLTAQASDSDGTVQGVTFYEGTTLIGTGVAGPNGRYSPSWTGVRTGSYSLSAQAIDDLGGQQTSTAAALTVVPNQPPSVRLSSPTADQTLTADAATGTAPITLTAEASDADGRIVEVAFYDQDAFLGATTQAPYRLTVQASVGPHRYSARASDELGAQTASAPVTLTVKRAQAQLYFIHADHLGTPRLIEDQQQTAVWRWDAGEPFGQSLPDDDADGDGIPFEFNLRFPGQYFDRETNLHYNYYRDYDPSIGRYIQSDPIGLAGGINTYLYANAAPTMYIDPLGLEPPGGRPAVVFTDMSSGQTTFYDPVARELFQFDSRNAVASSAAPGAKGPYSGNFTFCQFPDSPEFGTAKWRTTDPRLRWIHGGGTALANPLAPRQGWKPTLGCTRAQNEDVEELCKRSQNWKQRNPGMNLPYARW